MSENGRVLILPCSGIGKTYGTVGREAAYSLAEELRPGSAEVVALSLLVMGDEELRARVQASPVIAVDGCKLACASKMVAESGGRVAYEANAAIEPYVLRASPGLTLRGRNWPKNWPGSWPKQRTGSPVGRRCSLA
jgi:hypothetical protein